ncbi:uncharacterized protein LOC130722049 isoform X2 [Lotus japonicus]|uniref:uncharacterized protein LOC130722049 isoform X2 n=1 Tax=Lotus japonicus TaxID=34305 RepID=UPI002590897C|nr:uncharacterized protein LOC130722049 isoform X2 [Lotus japonicus]
MALASEEKVWGTTSYGARVQVVDHHDNVNVGSPSASASADIDWAAAKRMESENENKVLGTTSSDARVPAQLYHKRMVDRIGSIDKSLVRAPPYPIIVKLPDGNGITFNREAINDPLLVSSASTPMTITPTVIDHWLQTKHMESKYSEKKVSETALFGARLPVDEDHHDKPRNFGSFNKNSVTHSLFGLPPPPRDNIGSFDKNSVTHSLFGPPPRDNIGEVMKKAYFKPDWAEAKHMKLENTDVANGPSVDTGLVGAQPCPNIVMLPDDNGNMFNSENINNPCLMASASTRRTFTSIVVLVRFHRISLRMMLLAAEIRARYGGGGAMAREKADTA